MTLSVLVDVIPPAQADQKSSGDVLDGPKVHGQANDDDNKYGDEARVEYGREEVE